MSLWSLINELPSLKIIEEQLNKSKDEKWKEVAENNRQLLVKMANENKKVVKEIRENWNVEDLTGIGYKADPKRYGGDNVIYQKNPKLCEILPRGLVYVNDELVIFSFPKFFGLRNGDDDDTSMTQPISNEGIYFTITKKANGEMAQVAWLNEYKGWIIGSKNRKIVARNKDDVTQYQSQDCYSFACAIAVLFFEMLNKMGDERVNELQEFLTDTRLTIIFEIEQTTNQHVVPLYENRLVLIGASAIYAPRGIHPDFTYVLGKFLDCSSVADNRCLLSVRNMLSSVINSTSKEWNSEGNVLYVMNGDFQVIQQIKVKTWWYVVLRAIREKIRSHLKNRTILWCQEQIKNRLMNISQEMYVPLSFVKQFITLGEAFACWVISNESYIARFSSEYPLLWIEFLKENNLPFDRSILEIKLDLSHIQPPKNALLVLFQGYPGLGKNYLAERLKCELEKHNISSTVIDQDRFFHSSNASQACFDEVQRLVFGGNYDVVLLARNNANKKQYSKYLNFPKYMFIAPRETQTNPHALVAMCASSVLQRKNSGEEHITNTMYDGELMGLPFKFAIDYSTFPLAYQYNFLKEMDLSKEQHLMIGEIFGFVYSNIQSNVPMMFFNRLPEVERRNVNELINEIVPDILQGLQSSIPTQFQYIGVLLDENDKGEINELLKDVPGETVAHHVTLMHSNDFHSNRNHWFELVKRIGERVSIEVLRTKTKLGKVCAASVTMSDGFDELVYSKVPHLTLSVMRGGVAKDSIEVLLDDDVEWKELPSRIILNGTVTLLRPFHVCFRRTSWPTSGAKTTQI